MFDAHSTLDQPDVIVARPDQRPAHTRAPPSRLPAGAMGLPWLPEWRPEPDTWQDALRQTETLGASPSAWAMLVRLANTRLDAIATVRLDRCRDRLFGGQCPAGVAGQPVRLAILGSSTVAHLAPAIRVAGMRRGLWVETYLAEYGQAQHDILDRGSGLYAFGPNAVLFAYDARHMTAGIGVAVDQAQASQQVQARIEAMVAGWQAVQSAFGCQIIQQAVLPVFPALFGQSEHRLPGSPRSLIDRINAELRNRADGHGGVAMLGLDARVADDGLHAWHDPTLWFRAKQEIAPSAAPFYGDLVARVLAAAQGRSAKCLVLDCDNTLWGGVVGDDGVENIVLGQGSALGEAFVAVQTYARDLAARGIILAVCSKNDEANALAPFEQHPEMVLRRSDIACFVANWQDKATNLRMIAATLNIGLDSLVLLDDNPFERALVRRELPMVAVPELSDDPADYARVLADAGYFEALTLTAEDRERSSHYRSNQARTALQAQSTDLAAYLAGLDMQLGWRRFDRIGLQRITQLINKTNQFNLTTRRYREDEILAMIATPGVVGLQFRLADSFGDNGVIAIAIARRTGADALVIDTWLMSCRVLGREVERAVLNVMVKIARDMGCTTLIGEYVPSDKNAMVRDLYPNLGFAPTDMPHRHVLDLAAYVDQPVPMRIDGDGI